LSKTSSKIGSAVQSANEMLKILRSTDLQVPKDIRTIPHEYKVIRLNIEIENESYLNLGIYNILQPLLVKEIDSILNNITIKFSFSIDGLPLAKSFKTRF
jgi:hypothetical protein